MYAIASVDHALHLAVLLQQEGPMRVSEAAARLDVSVSTAHRLLAMLVYRSFAEQRPDRLYQAGRVLRQASRSGAPVARLREVAMGPLQDLVSRVEETANLVVLAGSETRFVATVECRQVLRVGDRAGRTLPAHLTSGGKAILAASAPAVVDELYAGVADIDLATLRRQLAQVRRRGFAMNDQRTEAGLTALGIAVRDTEGVPFAAVAIAMPSVRFRREGIPGWAAALTATARHIEQKLEGAHGAPD
jgi:IclR family acetate operon transcriptional repressor